MVEHDDLIDDILRFGPSAGSVNIGLRQMKAAGRLREVIQACIKFQQLYPDDIRLKMLLAEAYNEAGFVSLAGSELENAASMIDALAPAYKQLADIYLDQRRYGAAAEMLRRYLAHFPDQSDALDLLKRVEMKVAQKEDALAGDLPDEDAVKAEAETVDEPVEELVDLATPTIAELYFSQGNVEAAIQTYEKIVLTDPDDRQSTVRLDELKKSTREAETPEYEGIDKFRTQTERLIRMLEHWLPRVKGMPHA